MKNLAYALLVCAAAASAGNLAQEPVVFHSGNWKVHRGTSAMSDKTSCTGVYKDNFAIQLSADALYLQVRGGLESVQIRLDDAPASSLRLPSEMEKKINAVIIGGTAFDAVARAGRLRTSVGTMVNGIREDDLDLTGIAEALANIQAGCPGEPVVATAVTSTPAPAPSGCTERVKAKLKLRGLAQADIEDICNK